MQKLFLIAPTALVALSFPMAASAQQAMVCVCGSTAAHSHSDGSDGGAVTSPFQAADSDRWFDTATDPFNTTQGTPITLRWGIVPDGTPIPGGAVAGESSNPSSLRAFMDGLHGAGVGGADLTQRPWFPIFSSSFNRWGQLAGLTYVYEPNDDGSSLYLNSGGGLQSGAAGQIGVRGDVRIGAHAIDGQSGSNVLAYNFFPDTSEMVLDTGNTTAFGPSAGNNLSARNIIMHEHGHGLGFSHVESSNSNHLMEPFLATTFDGPQFDDILAAQRLYGDALEKSGGNDTAVKATGLGSIVHGSTVSRGTNADDTVVASTETDFISIDDNSDIDVFGFSVAPLSEVTLTLTPQGPAYNEGAQGGTQTTFNTAALSNLNLELLASDGTTVLATAAATGAGFAEIIAGFDLLAGGGYFARITGLDDKVQMYRLDVSAAAVPEPSVIALAGIAFAGLALRRRRA